MRIWKKQHLGVQTPCDEVIHIEHKIFKMRLGLGGKSIRWEERTRKMSYMMDFSRDEACWLSQRFNAFVKYPVPESDFQRYRGQTAVFTLQRFDNRRGCFIEVSKFNSNGRKQSTIVPSGFNSGGWKKIAFTLGNLLAGNYQRKIHHFVPYRGINLIWTPVGAPIKKQKMRIYIANVK